MRICICDDDKMFCEKLQKYLDIYAMQNDYDYFIYQIYDANKLLEEDMNFTIIFLDICFNSENIGVKIAEKLRENDNTSFIVFITTLPDYYPGCFEVEAFRYLEKPISDNTIYTTMDAIHKKLTSESPKYKKIIIQTYDGNTVIDTKKLIAIESDSISRRRKLLLSSGRQVETKLSLKEIKAKISPDNFAYTHQSYIVNLDHVEEIVASQVHLSDGVIVPIGRTYRDNFILSFEERVGDEI